MQPTQTDHIDEAYSTTIRGEIHDKAADMIATYGGSLQTIVVAYFVGEDDKPSIRLFQWAFHSNREEFSRLMSWAIRNDRLIRLVPFSIFAAS